MGARRVQSHRVVGAGDLLRSRLHPAVEARRPVHILNGDAGDPPLKCPMVFGRSRKLRGGNRGGMEACGMVWDFNGMHTELRKYGITHLPELFLPGTSRTFLPTSNWSP